MYIGEIGIDEAGRGPLAGPVSVGAVYIPKNMKLSLKGLKDSKKLTEKDREIWFSKIINWQKEGKILFSASLVSSSIVDKKGIVFATNLAMSRSLKKISKNPNKVFVFLDGSLHAPEIYKNQKTVIKGDEKIKSISLASIVAKVTRDRYMVNVVKKYPKYGFEIHKGYGTLNHRNMIKKHGASEIHRKTFLHI